MRDFLADRVANNNRKKVHGIVLDTLHITNSFNTITYVVM